MGVTCFLLGKWFQAAFVCRAGNWFAHAVHRKTRWASQLPTLHLAFQAASDIASSLSNYSFHANAKLYNAFLFSPVILAASSAACLVGNSPAKIRITFCAASGSVSCFCGGAG